MSRKRIYIDSGVLITAYRGLNDPAVRAVEILDHADCDFASSQFVKLEVLPKAIYGKRQAEVDFYNSFFAAVKYWAAPLEALVEIALQQANLHGLAALDALHIAAALSIEANEFVTTEKPTKPLHRVVGIRVISLQS